MRTPITNTAFPDDLEQNRQDRGLPPLQAQKQAQATALQSRLSRGAETGATGDAPPAEALGGVPPPAGRGAIPGPDAEARGERFRDTPLPVRIILADGRELRTLQDAGDFLSGRFGTLEPSPALQETTRLVVRAARTGTAEEVAEAALRLAAYVDAARLG